MPRSRMVAKTFGMVTSSEVVDFLSPALDPIRISYDDIVSATNNFSDDNLIKQGSFSDVYKGKLLWSKEWIDVVIRWYLPSLRLGRSEFLQEIQEHSDLKHRNTLPIVGFCDENDEQMMVFEYQHNGSLDKFIGDPTALIWSQRLKICLGAARFLRYVHEDIENRSIHGFDHEIKSSKILLDRDWEAKVYCIGFHIRFSNFSNSKSSYSDPENNRSHKSDVYSVGVILFEVICGKKAEGESFAQMAKQHYEEGKLDDMINPDLKKQMHPLSLSILSQIAYNCVQEDRKKRPRMNLIVEALQQALELPLKMEILEKYAYLKISLSDVMSATKNFDTTYCVGSESDVMVYKAHLDHYDINSLLTIERKNKELTKMDGESFQWK